MCVGLLAAVLCPLAASAQKRANHEFYKDFPVYVDLLQQQLTYPLAWGNSDITDFDRWRAATRSKVFECMMTPPPPAASYDVKVLGE